MAKLTKREREALEWAEQISGQEPWGATREKPCWAQWGKFGPRGVGEKTLYALADKGLLDAHPSRRFSSIKGRWVSAGTSVLITDAGREALKEAQDGEG